MLEKAPFVYFEGWGAGGGAGGDNGCGRLMVGRGGQGGAAKSKPAHRKGLLG